MLIKTCGLAFQLLSIKNKVPFLMCVETKKSEKTKATEAKDNHSIKISLLHMFIYYSDTLRSQFPSGLVVRISRSHRDGRGSIPRLGNVFVFFFLLLFCFLLEHNHLFA